MLTEKKPKSRNYDFLHMHHYFNLSFPLGFCFTFSIVLYFRFIFVIIGRWYRMLIVPNASTFFPISAYRSVNITHTSILQTTDLVHLAILGAFCYNTLWRISIINDGSWSFPVIYEKPSHVHSGKLNCLQNFFIYFIRWMEDSKRYDFWLFFLPFSLLRTSSSRHEIKVISCWNISFWSQ